MGFVSESSALFIEFEPNLWYSLGDVDVKTILMYWLNICMEINFAEKKILAVVNGEKFTTHKITTLSHIPNLYMMIGVSKRDNNRNYTRENTLQFHGAFSNLHIFHQVPKALEELSSEICQENVKGNISWEEVHKDTFGRNVKEVDLKLEYICRNNDFKTITLPSLLNFKRALGKSSSK